MITFTLSDSADTKTYDLYNAPFVDSEVGGEEETTTLNGNVYVDFIYTKRVWEREFAYMTEEEYLGLKGFLDRQRSTFRFPLLSIPDFGVENVPVYLKLSERSTINACGAVIDVKLTMRETTQQ